MPENEVQAFEVEPVVETVAEPVAEAPYVPETDEVAAAEAVPVEPEVA